MSPMSMRHQNERNFRDLHPNLYQVRRYGVLPAVAAAAGGISYLAGKYGLVPMIQATYRHGFKDPANYVRRLTGNVGSAIKNTPYYPTETTNSSKPTPIPTPEAKGYKSEQQKRF